VTKTGPLGSVIAPCSIDFLFVDAIEFLRQPAN